MSGAVLNTQGFGNRAENVEIPIVAKRSPSGTDLNYPIGKRWINTLENSESILTSKASYFTSTSAVWSQVSAGAIFISSGGISPPMVNGSVTVHDPAVLSTSSIFVSGAVAGGVMIVFIQDIIDGSFVITGSAGETSSFYYMVVN